MSGSPSRALTSTAARPNYVRNHYARQILAAWLEAVRAHPDAATLRADGFGNLVTIAAGIAWVADWRTLRSRPTLARLQAVSGTSETTVQRWTRWLEARGFLELLEPGTTARYRPAILHEDAPNLAREWLVVLPGDVSRTPPVATLRSSTPAQARESRTGHLGRRESQRQGPGPDGPATPGSLPRPSPDSSAHDAPEWFAWPPGRNPHRGPERLAACSWLTRRHSVLGRMTPRGLRSVLRPWFGKGYTPEDVRWALEHDPSGEWHHHGERTRNPAAWVRHRLSLWLGPDGHPIEPRSAQLRIEAERHRQAVATDWEALRSGPPRVDSPAALVHELRRQILRVQVLGPRA